MVYESPTERGWVAAAKPQTDPSYPALSASARRPLLVALTAAGTVLGALPALVILDVLWLVSVFAAIGVVTPAIYLRGFDTTRTVPPSAGEFAIAGVGTLFPALLGSLFWLGAYALVEWIADLMGVDERSTALFVTIPLAIGFGVLYTLMAVENLAAQLYPDVAGARSAHYAAAAQKSNLIVGFVVTVAVVVLTLLVFDSAETKAAVLLGYGLVFSSFGFGPDPESPSGAETDRISALTDLLANHGLDITEVPRTDDVALDPYLADIDLIATHGNTEYAVAFIEGDADSKGVLWTEAANLKLGAFAVNKLSADEFNTGRTVLPLLVVSASQDDERLVAYCQDEQIDLVQFKEDGVSILTSKDEDDWLREVDWQSLQPTRRTKEQGS